jgi:hypothetical protein
MPNALQGQPTHWPWPSTVSGIWAGKNRNDARWAEIRRQRLAGQVAAADAFRKALEADGWTALPTYSHEPVEEAFKATRDGLIVQGLARPGDERSLPTGSVNAWCAQGIALSPLPIIYPGFEALQKLARHCPECGKDDVDTVRVGFANRVCHECAPALRAKVERPGWND